jgi:2,4-dienoyl-CoA reductase-like NADH-dependent reductase (Old Yellow Enzyme family)
MCPPELVPNDEIISASDIPAERGGISTDEPDVKPKALTEAEVEEIIHAFGETTRRAIEAGYDGVEIHGALGRGLIIDPDWVQKIAEGKEADIVTEIDKNKQEELVIPNPLWNAIIHTPGWFPGI